MITRRDVVKGSAAIAAAGLLPASTAHAADGVRRIVARTGETHLLEAGHPNTPIWGYDGQVPGPALRIKQGEPLAIDLVNELEQATTIHWHGIRNINAMDGVAGLTQPAVEPGQSFAYRFTPPDAGTYWYHPHNRTWEQLARGLQGALIIEEETPPAVDQDLVLIIDDWRLTGDGKIHERSFGSMHDISHAGRLGNILTLNGQFEQDIAVLAGQRLRLRVINTANARIMGLICEGHAPVILALDGQPLDVPIVPDRNTVRLAPAQRADLIVDCALEPGAKTPLTVDTGRERLRLGQLVYHPSKRQRDKTLSDLELLPANPMPTDLDLGGAQEVDLVMTGGAMSAFESAEYRGRQMGIRELVRGHKKAWAFNGIVGMPDRPWQVMARGTTVKVRMVNRTAWPHAMHFHGHHVREIAHSARKPLAHWRDTVLVERGDEVTVAFKAHNPGKWMLHCHMLGHQAGGMSTWYEVT